MTDLAALDATAQAELVRNGDASAAELVDAAVGRIEKLNGELNAVIHPLFDRAHALVRSGVPQGPFSGVPIVIKDLDGTLAGAPYHAGNKALKAVKHVARYARRGRSVYDSGNSPSSTLVSTPRSASRRARSLPEMSAPSSATSTRSSAGP